MQLKVTYFRSAQNLLRILLKECVKLNRLHNKSSSQQHQLLNLPDFVSDCRAKHKSESAFVFGSSASILNRSTEFWRTCSSCFTVGLNFWLIHDFVPTCLSIETNHNQTRNRILSELLSIKTDVYKQTSIFAHYDFADYGDPTRIQFPKALSSNLYLNPRWKFPTLDTKELRSLLTFWKGVGWRFGTYHGISSVVSACSLCFLLGFKEIVLVGVDLNHTDYFWDASDKYSSMPRPPKVESDGLHYTARKDLVAAHHNQLTIIQQLELLQMVFMETSSSRLFFASDNSMLSDYFPRFRLL